MEKPRNLIYIILNCLLIPYSIYLLLDLTLKSNNSNLLLFFETLSYPIILLIDFHDIFGFLIIAFFYGLILVYSFRYYSISKKNHSISLKFLSLLIILIAFISLLIVLFFAAISLDGGLNLELKT